MAKQQKTQQYIYKINSSLLSKHKWNLTLPIKEARKIPGCVVSLSDSQILTWINELNGTSDKDKKAKEIKHEIKLLKTQKSSKENKIKISQLYDALYNLQFIKDYMCLVVEKNSDYDRANKGFYINGIKYRRFLATTGGVKMSTIVYVSERLYPILKRRLDNGRNKNKELVPAKLEAYQALVCSGSIPVSWPRGIIVVHDCMVEFNADIVLLDDSDDSIPEPVITEKKNEKIQADVSDGCSIMLPSLSRRWNGELNGDPNNTVSGVNLRCSWLKGMTFCMDYLSWARKNKVGYYIEDVWGDKRDIRESELIVTESQLKGWSWYSSWEDYYNNCIRNHYSIRIAKTAPHECDDVRQLNYQYINPYELDDDDIQELIAPTVNEIKDIISLDPRKSIVYLCGKNLDDKNVQYADVAAKALMIDNTLIKDEYIRGRIKKMIEKRIREAKIGVLNIDGNYQILSGDPVALCQSMFKQPITGVLKAGELYSKYWLDKGCKEVTVYRAPMSTGHNIQKQSICYSEEAQYWLKYIDTCIVVNAWDTLLMAESGADADGDLLCTTDNAVLLRRYNKLDALCCVQKSAVKKIPTEDDIIESNKQGFGNEVGSVTNKTSSQWTLRASFEKGSKEYNILTYRIQCGQNYNQNAVDKCKGIISRKMPVYWYNKKAIQFDPNDTKEVREEKELNLRICADKKPYFFAYLYPDYKRNYDAYEKSSNENACIMFGKTLDDLKCATILADEEALFLDNYKRRLPLDTSPSVMNKICWAVENVFDTMSFIPKEEFDYSVLKSNTQYNSNILKELLDLYKEYKKDSANINKKIAKKAINGEDSSVTDKNMLIDLFGENCYKICPDKFALCNAMIDLGYSGKMNKNIVWYVCGDVIIENLLAKNNNLISYPSKDKYGDIKCCGSRFSMKTIEVRW